MKTAQFLLLCILGAALLSAVNCNNANGPDNCCFKLYPGRIQKTGFITKKSRSVCVDALDQSSF
uniref:Chemokine interleukin-8-like domain-containing protein n=1 Tax=Maylandia zebra TaxID=106582 RepID=A0A3P9DCS5_9CICH